MIDLTISSTSVNGSQKEIKQKMPKIIFNLIKNKMNLKGFILQLYFRRFMNNIYYFSFKWIKLGY
jgi:hypothetical protein